MIGTMTGCIAASGVVTATAFDGMDIVAAYNSYDSKFVDTYYIGAKTRQATISGFTETTIGTTTAYDETNSSGNFSPTSLAGSFGTFSGSLVSAPVYPNQSNVYILGVYLELVGVDIRLVMNLTKPKTLSLGNTTSVIVSNSQSSLSDGSIDVGSWPTSSFTLTETTTSAVSFQNHSTGASIYNADPAYNYSYRSVSLGSTLTRTDLLKLFTDFQTGVYTSATQFPAFRVEIT